MSSPNHIILWRRLDLPGHDGCQLWQSTNGWQLSGTTIFLFNQMPCCLSYEVNTDINWQTSTASVSGHVGKSAVALTISAPHRQATASAGIEHWSINGLVVAETTGCIDLDLGFTPATNLIAIRRLSLEIGARSQAPAAWLDFPDFTLKQLEQQYHRLSDYQYEYTAPDVGYADVLEVDRNGAITRYPSLWEIER
ncbi:putative glycolipid-binding domain-containing protein [Phormidesmis sp. 146-12]